ncbi:hypothetical protein KYC5002_24295 [Archangium violaceum]|uniref:hypothetical protein n=1 Tax=Archangium violaceum TaxID=83451 RepID=UPI002B28DD3D|nr:hypothetical protein KYC5002_24295 [Archangium gephyra]
MPDSENEAFLGDPLQYIQATPVDIQWLTQRIEGELYGKNPPDHDYWLRQHPELFSGKNTIALDLVRRTHPNNNGVERELAVLRVDRSTWSAAEQKTMGDSIYKKFHAAKSSIKGFWFPYLSPPGGKPAVDNGTWGIANMGQVDFPRQNPQHPFIFTGQMNGCSIVITDSPLGNNYYRIYHYPNVSTYSHFKAANTWPNTRRYVWTEPEYGAVGDPNAWNFLHYEGGHWYLYCQPTSWEQGGIKTSWFSGPENLPPVNVLRNKAVRGNNLPGRIRIDQLTNTIA